MMDESDSFVQCPYDKAHILYRSRMQTHLVKCKLAHLNPQQNVEPVQLKVCKYNSNHHVSPAEYEEHLRNCKDIGVLTRFVTTKGVGSAVPYNPIELPPTDENWDDEEYTSTYDPEQHATSSVIIRAKQGVPKSVRRNFRMQERERINRLRETQEALERSGRASVQSKPDEVGENSAFSETRLRVPKSALLGMGRGRLTPGDRSTHQRMDTLGLGLGQELQDIPAMQSSATGGEVGSSSSDDCAEAPSDLAPGDGFVEQKGRRHRKMNGHLPVVGGSPLIPSNHSLPAMAGRGRGRLLMK